MGINIKETENNDSNQPNKVTGEEHNKVQIKVHRQMDLEELIKIIEEEENAKGTIQGDKA